MGEIADMILEGTLCEICGGYMEDDKEYPHACPDCEEENTMEAVDE